MLFSHTLMTSVHRAPTEPHFTLYYLLGMGAINNFSFIPTTDMFYRRYYLSHSAEWDLDFCLPWRGKKKKIHGTAGAHHVSLTFEKKRVFLTGQGWLTWGHSASIHRSLFLALSGYIETQMMLYGAPTQDGLSSSLPDRVSMCQSWFLLWRGASLV